MPTTIKFSRPIRKSPFAHLMRHMELAAGCAARLPQAVEAFYAGDAQALHGVGQQIQRLRSEATRALADVQDCLGRSMFLPVDRRDLVAVLDSQVALADGVQAITGLLSDLLPNVPRELNRPVSQLVEQCVAATGGAQLIVNALEPLVESGFRGQLLDETREWIDSVVRMGDEVRQHGRDISASLLGQCRAMDPVTIVLFYQLIERITGLADISAKLALRVRLLLVR